LRDLGDLAHRVRSNRRSMQRTPNLVTAFLEASRSILNTSLTYASLNSRVAATRAWFGGSLKTPK
jgi:hypothetical protein